jgi:hypothetical protein
MNSVEFLEKYEKINFKHNGTLIAGLKDNSWSLTSYTGGERNKMTASTFHQIYGKKAASLNKAEDEYSVNLQNELIDFCKNLEKIQDEIVDVYSFSDDQTFINVFVERTNEEIIGSIQTNA